VQTEIWDLAEEFILMHFQTTIRKGSLVDAVLAPREKGATWRVWSASFSSKVSGISSVLVGTAVGGFVLLALLQNFLDLEHLLHEFQIICSRHRWRQDIDCKIKDLI